MVTETEVAMAYRLILGREPESEEVVRGHVRGSATLADLRRVFLGSEEFRNAAPDNAALPGQAVGTKPLIWPKVACQVEVDADSLQALVARVEQQFDFLGKTEPHWSIVSEDQYRASEIAQNEATFYESGLGVVHDLMIAASRYDLDLRRYRTCFELGCGLGRSTIWLADQFTNVLAADISAPHLMIAKQNIERFQKKNVKLLHVKRIAEFQKLPEYDLFFSIIVLQHNPPPVIAFLLRTILSKLAPGGLAYFQVPTYGVDYAFDAAKYLETKPNLEQPSMHVLPQRTVFDIFREHGCHVVEVREDGAGGERMISNRFLVRKVAG